MLLIGGSARLTHLRGVPALGNETAGTSSGVENLPDLTLRDEGTGTVIDLGPVQAVSLTMASPGKCASAYATQQPEPLFLGQAQDISGQAAAPVQRQWRLGWWAGPRTSEDWPLIGNLPGIREPGQSASSWLSTACTGHGYGPSGSTTPSVSAAFRPMPPSTKPSPS